MDDVSIVTIVIPCYNSSATLEATLKSVLLQEFSNYEVIMVDDGSTDNTPEIIKKYEACDSRFHGVRQSNQGVSAARNKGVELSKTDFIAFLDADDIWYKNSLSERMKVLLHEKDPSLLGAFCPADMIFADGKSMGIPLIFNYSLPNDRLYFSFMPESVFNPTCVIIKKEKFTSIGGFEVTLTPAEDYDMWHRMMRTGGYFKIVRSCKIGYTQHPSSAVRSRIIKHYQQCKKVYDRIFSDSLESNQECQEGYGKSIYYRTVTSRAFRTAIMAIVSQQPEVAEEIIPDIRKYALETIPSQSLEGIIKFGALRALCRHEQEWNSVVWPQIGKAVRKFISDLNERLGGDCYSLLQLQKQLESLGQTATQVKQTVVVSNKSSSWFDRNLNTGKFVYYFFGYTLFVIVFTAIIMNQLFHN